MALEARLGAIEPDADSWVCGWRDIGEPGGICDEVGGGESTGRAESESRDSRAVHIALGSWVALSWRSESVLDLLQWISMLTTLSHGPEVQLTASPPFATI